MTRVIDAIIIPKFPEVDSYKIRFGLTPWGNEAFQVDYLIKNEYENEGKRIIRLKSETRNLFRMTTNLQDNEMYVDTSKVKRD